MRRDAGWLVAVLVGALTLLGVTSPAHAHDIEQLDLHVFVGDLRSYPADHELEPASDGDDEDGSDLGWVVPVAMLLAAAGGLGYWLIRQREAAS